MISLGLLTASEIAMPNIHTNHKCTSFRNETFFSLLLSLFVLIFSSFDFHFRFEFIEKYFIFIFRRFCWFSSWEFYMRWSYFIVTFCMELNATREKNTTSKKLQLKWQTEWLFLLWVVFFLYLSLFSHLISCVFLCFTTTTTLLYSIRFRLCTLLFRFACQCVPSLWFNYGLMRWR